MPLWSEKSAASASLTIFLPASAPEGPTRCILLQIRAGRLAVWHGLLFRGFLITASWQLLGGGGALLTLLLQAEDLRREVALASLPATLWLDARGSCWLSRWLLVFGAQDALGRRRRVAVFADQLAATDHVRLRRLLLRLRSGRPYGAEERFDLL